MSENAAAMANVRPNAIHASLICMGVVLIVLMVYFPGLRGGFLFDDFPNIVTNPRIHATDLTLESLVNAARAYEPGPYGRPLATMGFAIDYLIGDGDPLPFKIHGLLVHLVNTALVFALVLMILRLPVVRVDLPRAALPWVAGIVALVWAIHPLQVSSVLYIVQRMETLAAMFALLSVLAYVRGRQSQIDGSSHGWGMLATSVLMAGLGLLAKESAIIVALLVAVVEFCLFRFQAEHVRTRRILQGLYAVGAALGLVFVVWMIGKYVPADAYVVREFTAVERVLSQFRVLALYLGQILLPLPSGMWFYYDNYPHSTGLFAPITTLLGLGLMVVLLGVAVWVRKAWPLVTLGIVWFYAAHALTSGVIPLELVYEHRNYLALLGPLLVLAFFVAKLIPLASRTSVPATLAIIAVTGLASITLIRVMSWSSPLMLAMDMVSSNPGSARASNDLATLYFSMANGNSESPYWQRAMREFARARTLPAASPLPEQGLILMSASIGQEADPVWWDSMLEKLKTRAISPQESMAVMGILQQRDNVRVIDDRRLADAYTILTERTVQPGHVYCTFGDHALMYLGDQELARKMFISCVSHNEISVDHATKVAIEVRIQGWPDLADDILTVVNGRQELGE